MRAAQVGPHRDALAFELDERDAGAGNRPRAFPATARSVSMHSSAFMVLRVAS